MRKVLTWFLLGVLGIGILYIGVSCAATVMDNRARMASDPPDKTLAPFALLIRSTGQVLFTQDVAEKGIVTGKREYTAHNWYELTGKRFVLHKGTLTLKEETFGIIELQRR